MRTEWKLNTETPSMSESFVSFTDLFTSRLKKTLSELMSYRPDPECVVAQRRIENHVRYLRRSIRRI